MKKSGFTMAELLITLTIIGVTAALVIPAVMKMSPDKYKVRVLNIYNDLYAATENIMNINRNNYVPVDVAGGEEPLELDSGITIYPDGKYDCMGLACIGDGEDADTKYYRLLRKELGVEDEATEDNVIRLSDSATLQVKRSTDGNYHVITVNTGFGDNCLYDGEENCKNPDIFKIKVENDGFFSPADPLLDAYLRNPTNMHSRVEDFAVAKKFFDEKKDYKIED